MEGHASCRALCNSEVFSREQSLRHAGKNRRLAAGQTLLPAARRRPLTALTGADNTEHSCGAYAACILRRIGGSAGDVISISHRFATSKTFWIASEFVCDLSRGGHSAVACHPIGGRSAWITVAPLRDPSTEFQPDPGTTVHLGFCVMPRPSSSLTGRSPVVAVR